MSAVRVAKASRNEPLHRLAEQPPAGDTEEPGRLGVQVPDDAVPIHDEDRIRRGAEQPSEFGVGQKPPTRGPGPALRIGAGRRQLRTAGDPAWAAGAGG